MTKPVLNPNADDIANVTNRAGAHEQQMTYSAGSMRK